MTAQSFVSNPEAMMELGGKFATEAEAGSVFGLVGNMGTGKTHWTKGFLKSIQPAASVTSPTFSLVNEYTEGGLRVHHFDFYRLKSGEELIALGWDEYLDDHAVVICEWADLFPELMPENTRWLRFSHLENNSRMIEETGSPATSQGASDV